MPLKHPKYSTELLSLPRFAKILVVVTLDLSLCVFTVWFAFYLRLGTFVKISDVAPSAAALSIVFALPVFYVFGLYRAIFRFSEWQAIFLICKAVFTYSIIYASVFTAIGVTGVPRTIGIIQPILLLLSVGASRELARLWLGGQYQNFVRKSRRTKVLIYGAGETGRSLANALQGSFEMQVVGFLDDDARLQGRAVNTLPVHNPSDLASLVKVLTVSSVLLAMPSVNRHRRNQILKKIREAKVSVQTLPSVTDLVKGTVTISDIHELDIDDLLGRELVAPNKALLSNAIAQKTIMVTGAGGSIGSELCRQIIEQDPQKLLLVEQSEFALYNIHEELETKKLNATLIPLLGSIQDENRLNTIISTWKPHTIYHAAAYKHVPLVEHNVIEGIKNNIIGTLRTAQAALSHKTENFVLISTDKAVRPTNIMGASKRLSEIILQALAAKEPATNFSLVRFGNVLDSSGSVVPKFRQQIKNGGPVTITHPDITRFFMTIPEAAQLVIQAGTMAKGGDVFVLDMGEPVKIIKLARRMIELSGLTERNNNSPDGDIEIKITGLRPGEKLYEELLLGNNPERTCHSRIMKAHEAFICWEKLEVELSTLENALNKNDIFTIHELVKTLVPEYNSAREIVDWQYLKQKTTEPE